MTTSTGHTALANRITVCGYVIAYSRTSSGPGAVPSRARVRSKIAPRSTREFMGEDVAPDLFWENVKTNLQANKIRLIFIADDISQELRRIIEFLNENMSFVEVLGVEIIVQLVDIQYRIDQYTDNSVKVYDMNTGAILTAKPALKRINKEKALGVEETFPNGSELNTQQVGARVIKQLRKSLP